MCGGCGKDTLPVSLRCDTPSEHGAAFLRSTHCNPWRWRACPAARHYANVNHAWLATRLCVCPSHGFTFHPNFIGASGLFVCFNWINFSETDLCRRAMGRSIAINPARELLTVFILESFNSSEGKEGGGGVSFTSFYNLIILIFKSYMTHLSQSQSKCIISTIRLTPFAWKEKKK